MSEVIDWQAVPNPEDAVRAAVAALRDGQLVVLPTETGYVLAASGRCPAAVTGLSQLVAESGKRLAIAVTGESGIGAWIPAPSPIARRLARRLWPGPVTLAFRDYTTGTLPGDVARCLVASGELHLRCPMHEAVRAVQHELSEVLLMADVPPLAAPGPITGARLAETFGGRVALVLDDGPARFPEGATVVSISGERWQVARSGAVPADRVRMFTACLVVFVCTGNTCRSPLAEALCKKRLSDRLGCRPERTCRSSASW